MSTALELFTSNAEIIGGLIPAGLGLTVDRLKQVMLFCLRQTPSLADCEPGSVVASVAQVASLGLDLTPAVGHAYLVPYGSKCQLQIGYKGFIALATRSHDVSSITAHAVYDGDHFEFEYGTAAHLCHRPTLANRGKLRAAWAEAVLPDGTRVFRVIGMDDIDKAAGFGQTKRSDSPWKIHRDEMARKTAIRRLIRDLVLSTLPARALATDDMVVTGMSDGVIDVEAVDVETDAEPAETPRGLKSKIPAPDHRDRSAHVGDTPENPARVNRPADMAPAGNAPSIEEMRDDLVELVGTFGCAPSSFREFAMLRSKKDLPPVGEWDARMLDWALRGLRNGLAAPFRSFLEGGGA